MGFLSCLGAIESAPLPTIGGLLNSSAGAGASRNPLPGGAATTADSPYMTYLQEGASPPPASAEGVPLGQLLGEAGLGQSIDGVPGNLIGTFF